MSARRFRLLLRLVPALLLLTGAAGAAAADPPGRVARLNDVEGSVTFARAGDNEWTDAQSNRPLTRGDRLWTDRGTRAEFQVGSSAVRLDGQTRLDILALDDQTAQFSVTGGSVYVRVRSLPDGENFEIDTPNLAYRASAPGDYRIDVDTAEGFTRVTIHAGAGTVYGENGQPLPLGGGQQITFRGRALAQVNAQESPPDDAFDRWAVERNRHEDQSVAARYVPREVVGYQQLDPYGRWRRNPVYGAIWVPQAMPAGWAPYRQGHWTWVEPWGWTWIDDAPWGFAPFHYGRWALVDDQWAWVPGRLSEHPIYAPALVAFVGGSAGDIAWFPLAPNEAWQPPYPASPLYISNVNRNIPLAPVAAYAYQRRPEALTAISLAQFDHGRPAAGGWWRVARNVLTSAPIVEPPPLLQPAVAVAAPRPSASAVRQPPAPAPAVATPAPTVHPSVQQAAAAVPPPTTKPPEAARAPSPRAAAPVAQSRTLAAPAVAQTARVAGKPHARDSRAGHAERVRREQAGRAPQAAAQQVARRRTSGHAGHETSAHREAGVHHRMQLAQARRDEQRRRVARARADEELRREAHATQLDLARRVAAHDAQMLRDQRLKREAQARRAAQEQAQQRDAWPREPQPTADPWQREPPPDSRPLVRTRPDLHQPPAARAPDAWQRGVPILNPGSTS